MSLETLAARLVPGSADITPLAGGVSAAVHLVEGGGRQFVVREPPEDGLPAAAEFALLEQLRNAGVAVAEPILLEEPFLVMAFVEGDTNIDESRLGRMARCLAEIHAVDHSLCPPLPPREDPVSGILEYLPEVEIAAPVHRLLRDRPALESQCDVLLHGDYWPANIIWQGDDIAAVIDWEDAAIGDPMCDLAGARLELTWALGCRAADEFTKLYLDAHPADHADLPIWEMFVSAAALAFMDQWGLPPQTAASRRSQALAFFQTAASAFVSHS